MNIDSIWQNKKSKIALIGLGAILVAWLGMATWLSKIHIAQKNIEQFWDILEQSCQHRVELLPKIAQLVIESKMPNTQQITQELKQVYDKNKQFKLSILILNESATLATFYELQKEVVDVILQIDKQVASFPLAQNKEYLSFLKQVETIDAQIVFSVLALNRQVAIYNRIVGNEPQKWVNRVYPRYPLKFSVIVPLLHGQAS